MSDIWAFSVKNSKIIPALLISYFHLSPHLKRCFVYCSLYPKDYRFMKDELILLWMAEDFLPPPKRGDTLEEVGCECFDELTSRLFFTKIQDGDDYFVMHDLLHDLAIFLAGDFYCNSEEFCEEEEIRIQTRHLCLNLRSCSSKLYNSISKVESLRTLLFKKVASCNFKTETPDILSKCKYLRALSFHRRDELPNSIERLIHLRYLDLSHSNIERLPESLCNLCNLQTLKLYCCYKLTTLPSGIHKLVNLRHFDLRGTSLKEMPRRISKLKHLPILNYFVVGKHEDNGIQELGGLSNLQSSFEIKKIENVVDARQARSARIMDKKHIDRLCLKWSPGDGKASNTQREREILESMQPHNGLKELEIKGYKGTIFPDWLGHCSYNNMTRVSLKSCKNCCMLPSLGQLPSLKSLSIEGFGKLKSVGMEFYKDEGDYHSSPIVPFPSLEELIFYNMPSWEEWHLPDSEAFPQLKSLHITNCRMLKEDMVNQVLVRIVSSSSDVSKVRQLEIGEGQHQKMILDGDSLSIRGCESVMKSAFKARIIHHLTSLQKLTIGGCREMELLQQQQKYDLEELHIDSSCDSLRSFSLDAFPNLKTLEICNCQNLESVSMSETPHAALHHLSIFWCDKLVSLPCHMNTLLPNLDSLEIQGCPEMCRFPEGALPRNLKKLRVGRQRNGLSWTANLDALTHLTIHGDRCELAGKSYPEVGSLPHLPSLTFLQICGFGNLETLECNELLGLTSLQQLSIQSCHELENMAGEKLPNSLLLLKVDYCPFLGEHCKNKHQNIWPKISHIPTIQVDGEQIF